MTMSFDAASQELTAADLQDGKDVDVKLSYKNLPESKLVSGIMGMFDVQLVNAAGAAVYSYSTTVFPSCSGGLCSGEADMQMSKTVGGHS